MAACSGRFSFVVGFAVDLDWIQCGESCSNESWMAATNIATGASGEEAEGNRANLAAKKKKNKALSI